MTFDKIFHRAAPPPISGPVLVMSPPTHFEVTYRINAWMQPDAWSADPERLARDARAGWAALRAKYESLGATILEMPARKGLPDLVFTANCAAVLNRKAVLASYYHAERQGEEPVGLQFFESLKRRGLITDIITMPPGVHFEGAGDCVFDAARQMIWMGYGPRSSRQAQAVIAQAFGLPVASLELVQDYYHLDTCFSVLSGGEVIVYPDALSPVSMKLIQRMVPADKLIIAAREDAASLAVNCFNLGQDIVSGNCSEPLRADLTRRGYRVHTVDLGSFAKSGGAAFCLTLRIDRLSRRFAVSGGAALGEPVAA